MDAAISASPIHIWGPLTLEPFLYSLVVTLGLRGALNRALDGPIFRSMSGLESFEYGIVNVGMIGGGCICVRNTHTEAFGDSGTLLVFVGGDFGPEMGSKTGAGGPHFYVCEWLWGAETWHCKRGDDLKRLHLRHRYTYGGPR